MQTQNEVVIFFYNLAEFVFEYFRDSRRILCVFSKGFFLTQIGHVRYINILTCSEALGTKLQLLHFILFLNSRERLGYKENDSKYRSLS